MKLVDLVRTCTACPSQWEGKAEDGTCVYVRYRFGELSVGYGADIPSAVRNDRIVWQSGDPWAGYMTNEEMLDRTGLEYIGEILNARYT